jgi:hypothetical protein
MTSETSQPIADPSNLYLEQLEELISEMNVGMQAIATNSVDVLRESIAKQESLCASLAAASLADDMRLQQLSQSPHPLGENDVDRMIWEASNAVRQLNLHYAALLKHSGSTITVLSALCSNHTGTSNEPHGPWSKQQTWSCEI